MSERKTRWYDIPGLFALAIVLVGTPVFMSLFATLSFMIHGRWPGW